MKNDIINVIRRKSKLRGHNFDTQMPKSNVDHYVHQQPVYKFFNLLADTDLKPNLKPIDISTIAIDQHENVPFHFHNFTEITIPLIGDCTIETPTNKIMLHPYDILMIGTQTIHKVLPLSKNDLAINISLRPNAFSYNEMTSSSNSQGQLPMMLMLSGLNNEKKEKNYYSLFRSHNQTKIKSSVNNILDEYYNSDDFSSKIIQLELLILFNKLSRLIANQPSFYRIHSNNSDVLAILLYIEKNYATITLNEIAAHFGYNPDYLTHLLRDRTGMSFIKLVKLQRINIAAQYLSTTTAPINDIARSVGYENPSYFYKVFRNIFRITPKEYRLKSYQNGSK